MATKHYRKILSAGSLSGDAVYNHEGEKIGKIEEIMLDVEEGAIAYAVLSFGGFLGIGNKLFAIPWGALQVDERNKRFLLNVKKETLEKAEGFDKDNWPDVSDPDIRSQLYSYYGVSPYWSEGTGEAGRRHVA